MPSKPPLFGLCASAPVLRAQATLEHVQARGALDPYRAVTEKEGRVLIPVSCAKAAETAPDAVLVEAVVPPNPRRAPIDRVREHLRGRIPDQALGALPSGFQRVGDVVLLRLPLSLREYEDRIGEAYGAVLGADAVLHVEGAYGPMRTPRTRHLWGDEDTETVHRENGLSYRLDPQKVLFSPGNHHERHRVASTISPGETVVDLFAGVGYFTLPLARAGARVIACELNETSIAYLEENLRLNGLEDYVDVRLGDARTIAPENVAERILMGYFPGTLSFLATALRTLSPQGGLLHVHLEREGPDPIQKAKDALFGHPELEGYDAHVVNARRVKTTGPCTAHVAIDLEVNP